MLPAQVSNHKSGKHSYQHQASLCSISTDETSLAPVLGFQIQPGAAGSIGDTVCFLALGVSHLATA